MEVQILQEGRFATNITQCFTDFPTSDGQTGDFWEQSDGDSGQLCL